MNKYLGLKSLNETAMRWKAMACIEEIRKRNKLVSCIWMLAAISRNGLVCLLYIGKFIKCKYCDSRCTFQQKNPQVNVKTFHRLTLQITKKYTILQQLRLTYLWSHTKRFQLPHSCVFQLSFDLRKFNAHYPWNGEDSCRPFTTTIFNVTSTISMHAISCLDLYCGQFLTSRSIKDTPLHIKLT